MAVAPSARHFSLRVGLARQVFWIGSRYHNPLLVYVLWLDRGARAIYGYSHADQTLALCVCISQARLGRRFGFQVLRFNG